MSSDWAKRLASDKKQQIESRQLQQEKDLSDRKMLQAHSGKMWEAVCKAMDQAAKQLSNEMNDPEHITAYRIGPQLVLIRRKSSTNQYPVEFDPGTWTITTQDDSYCLKVMDGNGVAWGHSAGSEIYTEKEVAQIEVERVFKSG
ncbi:MAG TPA: hypothetical protein VI636_17195 [Candidatus Angelobacter sp.]